MKHKRHHATRHLFEHPPRFWVAVAFAMFVILLVWIATFRITRTGNPDSLFSIFRSAGEQVRSIFQTEERSQADDQRIDELRKRVFPEFE